MHCLLLSETLVWKTTVYGAHWEMDRWEWPPLAKIPCHESNRIDGSSIGGSSIDLWRVAGHLHIPFKDTWWTCARCAKKLTEPQFWIPSIPASVFGHGKYGNTNHIPTIHGFPTLALVGVTALSPSEWNPSFRNHHRRRSPGNGHAGIRGGLSRGKLYKP